MRLSRFCTLTIFGWVLFQTVACSSLVGNLRREFSEGDQQDSPEENTSLVASGRTGGSWPEKGYLDESEPQLGGRSIASVREGNPREGWISGEMNDQNRRDAYRGVSPETEELAAVYGVSPIDPKRVQPKRKRTTREDFEDKVKDEGSLWASDGQTNYYFTKNKIRGPGDIVAIQVEKDLLKDIILETTRTLTQAEGEAELADAQKRIDAEQAADGVKTSSAAPSRSTASKKKDTKKSAKGKGKDKKAAAPEEEEEDEPTAKVKKATVEDIDVSKAFTMKEGDVLLAEIQERYPNGNFKVRATKKVPYRNGFRMVNYTGVVKGSEISEDDKVLSGKVYEYRVDIGYR